MLIIARDELMNTIPIKYHYNMMRKRIL